MADFLEEPKQGSVIKWKDEYNVGVGIIDGQHRHFITILNRLYECLVANDAKNYPGILDELKNYADQHFQMEEKYFDEFRYADADEHKAAHAEIKSKVGAITSRKGDLLVDGFELLEVLENWLVNHLETMDKKFTGVFNQNGLN